MRVRSKALLVIAAALVACNALVGFDDLERVPDGDGGATPGMDGAVAGDSATPRDDAGGDAIADSGPRCDPDAELREPELASELDGLEQTRGAILSPDEREVFFLRRKDSKWELRHGRRARPTDAWDPTAIATVPLDPAPQRSLSLSVGALKLYFWVYDTPDLTSGANYVATRASTAASFGAPTRFANVESPLFVNAGDDMAYWHEQIAVGEAVIKRAFKGSSSVGTGELLANVHEPGSSDYDPVLNASETRLYFRAYRDGGLGATDVYRATRATRQAAFSTPEHVRQLSSTQIEGITWASDDDCEVLLDRLGHIWRARRGR